MSTLREIHERCKTRHSENVATYTPQTVSWCVWCQHLWPCPDFEDAVAALAQLAKLEAERDSLRQERVELNDLLKDANRRFERWSR